MSGRSSVAGVRPRQRRNVDGNVVVGIDREIVARDLVLDHLRDFRLAGALSQHMGAGDRAGVARGLQDAPVHVPERDVDADAGGAKHHRH